MKTDAQIKRDVSNELSWDPAINSNQVGVSVENGVVTLSGHIDNFWQKYAIEKAASRVEGVKAIAMEVDVKLDPSHKRNDSEIAQAVESALKWHSQVPEVHIKVKVEKGWVTLSGEVPWNYQRQSAESAVRPLIGVIGVTNSIAIKPSVTPANVKQRIQEAFARQAAADAKAISVQITGDSATLSGSVPTWAERDAAAHATWSAPGISHVSNQIHVM